VLCVDLWQRTSRVEKTSSDMFVYAPISFLVYICHSHLSSIPRGKSRMKQYREGGDPGRVRQGPIYHIYVLIRRLHGNKVGDGECKSPTRIGAYMWGIVDLFQCSHEKEIETGTLCEQITWDLRCEERTRGRGGETWSMCRSSDQRSVQSTYPHRPNVAQRSGAME
jgi:hypothetical protein